MPALLGAGHSLRHGPLALRWLRGRALADPGVLPLRRAENREGSVSDEKRRALVLEHVQGFKDSVPRAFWGLYPQAAFHVAQLSNLALERPSRTVRNDPFKLPARRDRQPHRRSESSVDEDLRSLERAVLAGDEAARVRLRRERWRRGEDVGFEVGDRVRIKPHGGDRGPFVTEQNETSGYPVIHDDYWARVSTVRLRVDNERGEYLCCHPEDWTLLEPHNGQSSVAP